MESRRQVCRRLHEKYVTAQTAREKIRGAFIVAVLEAHIQAGYYC